MITTVQEYEFAQQQLRQLEERLARLRNEYPIGKKGYTKAGVRKMISRLHEELAVYEAGASEQVPSAE